MDLLDFDRVWWVRWLLQRGLAAMYLLAFVSALNQFPALLGERGILPVTRFLARVTFREAPSLFHLRYSDNLFRGVAWLGVALAAAALSGLSERAGVGLSFTVWALLWLLYLSIVNVGQTFYGFGWEMMLLEAGFFAAFLGPAEREPSVIPVFALRWMLFRTEIGAGLIKLRHDSCWRDFTCLYYHYETQPLPNPLSWYAHHLPRAVHRLGVAFSHYVQLVVPFGLFLPQPYASLAGVLIIVHQLLLILSGNYAWLNWLTVVLGFSALGDSVLLELLPLDAPRAAPRSTPHQIAMYLLLGLAAVLSVKPVLNLFSSNQRMNASYNPLHLVNTYGAFGSVTRERFEVIVEGSADEDGASWQEYEFKGKPGDVMRRPPQVAPYHLRLDWMMWFLPLGSSYQAWFLGFVEKLLEGDPQVRKLLRKAPFAGQAPRYVRATLYQYAFTSARERQETGAWWKREPVGTFLPPLSLEEARARRVRRPFAF
jgi:hypothetical protein